MQEKLNAKNLGLAGGILWGLVIFVLTLISVPTGYATQYLNVLSSIYIGYSVSLVGSVIGMIHGFICGFVGLYLLAWLYNWLGRKR
ncbi:MAG: bacteriophage holin [Candidatus Aenigmatarchaeota archaeon]